MTEEGRTQSRDTRAQRRDHEATEEQGSCDLADLRKEVKGRNNPVAEVKVKLDEALGRLEA